LKETLGRDPEADLLRAVELAPESRILHLHLIRHYQDQGRWEAALTALTDARARFPGDFDLDLLQARTLMNLGRALEATQILETTHVLPSEGARESHRLYEQAHTLAALDAMDRGAWAGAREHLMSALEWPESLGQGRPYEPEERLVRFILGRAETALGNQDAAREAFEAVVERTGGPDGMAWTRLTATGAWEGPADRLDLLAIPALQALGRSEELSRLGWDPMRLEFLARDLQAEFPRFFDDLEGGMLLRALESSPGVSN
jgi:tetratricopeptide (TPR) repeat protein